MLENYQIIKKIFFIYIFFLSFFAFLFPKNNPTIWHLIFQGGQAIAIFIMGYFLFQRDRGILYFTAGIAVYLFFNILLYR